MQIIDHKLHLDDGTPIPFVPTPNCFKWQKVYKHEYLVMHYTAAPDAQSALAWMTNKQAQASAHLLIGKDGSITQLVPFDTVAWHAGASLWVDRTNLNRWSIGIEFDNYGLLTQKVGGKWKRGNVSFDEDQVVVAPAKRGFSNYGWPKFTEEQITAGLEVSRLIFQTYDMLDVIGHDDINTLGKVDPGPAFPLERFRAHCMGINEGDPIAYTAIKKLYLRSEPSDTKPLASTRPVFKGMPVDVLERNRLWARISVTHLPPNTPPLEGWTYETNLKRLVTV